MTLTATLTSGLHLFASAALSRSHRSPAAADVSAYTHAATQPMSIEHVLAGRPAGNGLAMRWSTDDASLRATWDGPKQTS